MRPDPEEQPSAMHIHKAHPQLEKPVKSEAIQQALMDQIKSYRNEPLNTEEDNHSNFNPKEQFIHWSPDQPSENASEEQPRPPEMLKKQSSHLSTPPA